MKTPPIFSVGFIVANRTCPGKTRSWMPRSFISLSTAFEEGLKITMRLGSVSALPLFAPPRPSNVQIFSLHVLHFCSISTHPSHPIRTIRLFAHMRTSPISSAPFPIHRDPIQRLAAPRPVRTLTAHSGHWRINGDPSNAGRTLIKNLRRGLGPVGGDILPRQQPALGVPHADLVCMPRL